MIYTITFSPSIDYIPYVSNFELGQLNRATAVSYYPGGKGINISRVLSGIHCDTTALGFIGGFTGRFIEDFLTDESVNHHFMYVREATRINVKIKSEIETDLNGPSPQLNAQNEEYLKKYLENNISTGDFVVVSGTIPSSISNDFFEFLEKNCIQNNAKWILDTSGPRLKELLIYHPYLIKPNEFELQELVGKEITNLEDALEYAQQIVNEGIEIVVVSLGAAGAICASATKKMIAKAPKGKVVNTVGSGDSLVAGMLSQIVSENSLEDAFIYGVASGSATAFTEDLCTFEQIEDLVKEVAIELK